MSELCMTDQRIRGEAQNNRQIKIEERLAAKAHAADRCDYADSAALAR